MSNFAFNSKKICPFSISYTKSFLHFGRAPSQFLRFSALEGLVYYRPVSYAKKCINAERFMYDFQPHWNQNHWVTNSVQPIYFSDVVNIIMPLELTWWHISTLLGMLGIFWDIDNWERGMFEEGNLKMTICLFQNRGSVFEAENFETKN